MSNYFTHYWKNETCDDMEKRNYQGKPLTHTANDEFCAFGNHCVKEEDYVYVVTVKDGELILVAKIEVEDVTNQIQAAKELKTTPDELWEAKDHIIGKSCIPIDFHRGVPTDITEELEFESPSGPKRLKFVAPGKLDQQTLRGVRQLTSDSVEILEEWLDT